MIEHEKLTLRELEIVESIINTVDIDISAKNLFITRSTISTHLNNIYKKLDIHSVANLIKYFYQKEIDRLYKENKYYKALFIENKIGRN